MQPSASMFVGKSGRPPKIRDQRILGARGGPTRRGKETFDWHLPTIQAGSRQLFVYFSTHQYRGVRGSCKEGSVAVDKLKIGTASAACTTLEKHFGRARGTGMAQGANSSSDAPCASMLKSSDLTDEMPFDCRSDPKNAPWRTCPFGAVSFASSFFGCRATRWSSAVGWNHTQPVRSACACSTKYPCRISFV